MSLLPSGFSGGGGFYSHEIDGSLRFNDDDSAYLNRTPASAGNRKTWTWSGWVKRGNLGSYQVLFGAGVSTSTRLCIRLDVDKLYVFEVSGGSTIDNVGTNAVFRDVSAWYHVTVTYNSTESTSTDRIKIYVNGELQTSLASTNYPTLDRNGYVNLNTSHFIGMSAGSTQYFDGYLAEVHFIDGQALDATSFGEFKGGVWIPKAYAGTYGTNGFYLDFGQSMTADQSGNGNNWTANNLAASDLMLDSPTNNFAVLNPLTILTSQVSLSEGNLKADGASGTSNWGNVFSTINVPSSGKYYIECLGQVQTGSGNQSGIGVINTTAFQNSNTNYVWDETSGEGFDGVHLNLFGDVLTSKSDGVTAHTVSSLTASSYVLMLAIDIDNGKVFGGYDGTWMNSGNPVAGTGQIADRTFSVDDTVVAHVSWNGSNDQRVIANFGQDSSFAGNKTAQGNTDANGIGDFYYAPPAGYLALCTANLTVPDAMNPALDNSPQDYFNTVIWTGNGSTQSINVGFPSEFTWIKTRSSAYDHWLTDIQRSGYVMASNLTVADVSIGALITVDADGFNVANHPYINGSGSTYVAWNWKANGSGVSNTDGSITSTVSANTDAGFSIVSYTGTGANATVGHGLSQAPEMIISKSRNNTDGDAGLWDVYHKDLTSATYFLRLHTADAELSAPTVWNSTAPASSVYSIGTASGTNAGSSATYIAYCFHSVEGFSKFGSYTGNGSTDGPFVYCGFRPAFVMIKRAIGGTASWMMQDSTRLGRNPVQTILEADTSDTELTLAGLDIDMLSNGFKCRNLGAGWNASGSTYIYMAFAESPFKYSNAR